jgi:hypothetical protein
LAGQHLRLHGIDDAPLHVLIPPHCGWEHVRVTTPVQYDRQQMNVTTPKRTRGKESIPTPHEAEHVDHDDHTPVANALSICHQDGWRTRKIIQPLTGQHDS